MSGAGAGTAASPAATAALEESDPVSLERVESELARRLKAAQGPGDAPVQRAHMSNLVIYCDEEAIASAVAAQVPAIVGIHPARVLLLVGEPGGETRGVEATVHVRGLHAGGGPRVVAEQVTLRAGGTSVARLPYAVRSQAIGDLPTNVWWASRTPPPLAGPILFELTERAQQVVYDSLNWLEPNRGVAATWDWLGRFERRRGAGRWRVASDLNWRRLKGWRRLLGQALAEGSAPGAAGSIVEVALEHGPHAVTQGWQLLSWLASRLGWRVQAGREQGGVELSWQATASHGTLRLRIRRLAEGPAEVSRVRIACAPGGEPGALVLVSAEGRLSVIPEGACAGLGAAARTVAAPVVGAAELVGRQLSDRGRDPVFVQSMAVAQLLARTALG